MMGTAASGLKADARDYGSAYDGYSILVFNDGTMPFPKRTPSTRMGASEKFGRQTRSSTNGGLVHHDFRTPAIEQA
jgi:hypothetical protein